MVGHLLRLLAARARRAATARQQVLVGTRPNAHGTVVGRTIVLHGLFELLLLLLQLGSRWVPLLNRQT